jgi:hypothetical protein
MSRTITGYKIARESQGQIGQELLAVAICSSEYLLFHSPFRPGWRAAGLQAFPVLAGPVLGRGQSGVAHRPTCCRIHSRILADKVRAG